MAFFVLVLYGVLPAGSLQIIILLFVIFRSIQLLQEGFQDIPDWENTYQELLDYFKQLSPEELAEEAIDLGADSTCNSKQLADKTLNIIKREYLPSRPWNALICEMMGMLGLVVFFPLNIYLYNQEFVSFWEGFSYLGYGIALACITLYLVSTKYIDTAVIRKIIWLLAFMVTVPFITYQISEKHRYLDPFNPDKVRLKAEKILSLNNNVKAASYWRWLFDNAVQLQKEGRVIEAAQALRYLLSLVPNNEAVRKQLETLLQSQNLSFDFKKQKIDARHRAFLPVWTKNQELKPLHSCVVNNELRRLNNTTIIIVPIGDVPMETINIIGNVVRKELDLSVCVSKKPIPLPEYSRYRGLMFGKQWHVDSLIEAFFQTFEVSAPNLALYLMVTNKDIYDDYSNYLFSYSHSWGATLSNSRFDEGDRTQLMQRTVKQALGALAKILGATASTDPYCVTSYTSNMFEFDAKGNRPNLQTKAIIDNFVRQRDLNWLHHIDRYQ